MQSHAGFQFHGTLPDVVASHPSFQQVVPGGEMLQAVAARCICLLKMRCFQDENGSAHSFVNFTMNGDHAGLIENNRGRFFVFAIAAQIEAFCFRIGKNVMVRLVHVRKIDGRADQNRQEVGRERDVLLRHQGGGFGIIIELRTKIALQINDRGRRICRGHRNIVAGGVALVETAIKRRFRQLDSAFNNYLSPNGFSSKANNENEDRISAAHRYSGYSEKGASLTPNPVGYAARAAGRAYFRWSVRYEWLYSVRSAAIGLMRVARRAGSHVATKAAAASKAGATVKAIGSSAPTS